MAAWSQVVSRTHGCLVEQGGNGYDRQASGQYSLVLVLPGKAPLRLLPLLGQDEAQLLVRGEGGQGAVDSLAGLCCVPVVFTALVDPVAAGCALVVVPPRWAFS